VDTVEIESGQGRAVARRIGPLWQRHVGAVFEDLARSHAARLVASGDLPVDLIIGRWWAVRGMQCEVDVLGQREGRTVLLGEARWQKEPLDLRALDELKRKTSLVPKPIDTPVYAFWSKAGVMPAIKRMGALGFDLRAMLRKR
jgi:hypothetical protein